MLPRPSRVVHDSADTRAADPAIVWRVVLLVVEGPRPPQVASARSYPSALSAMKAIVCAAYGPPEVLRLAEVEKPRPGAHDILVRVHAAGISDSDSLLRGWKVPKAWFPLRLVFGI